MTDKPTVSYSPAICASCDKEIEVDSLPLEVCPLCGVEPLTIRRDAAVLVAPIVVFADAN